MNDLNPFRRIIVSLHALDRTRERLGESGCALLQRDEFTLPHAVRAEVRISILADRVAEVRPHWTHGDSMSRDTDYGHDARFVYDRAAARCWVVESSDEAQNALIVKTLLLSSDEEARLAQTKLVRAGQVRR